MPEASVLGSGTFQSWSANSRQKPDDLPPCPILGQVPSLQWGFCLLLLPEGQQGPSLGLQKPQVVGNTRKCLDRSRKIVVLRGTLLEERKLRKVQNSRRRIKKAVRGLDQHEGAGRGCGPSQSSTDVRACTPWSMAFLLTCLPEATLNLTSHLGLVCVEKGSLWSLRRSSISTVTRMRDKPNIYWS